MAQATVSRRFATNAWHGHGRAREGRRTWPYDGRNAANAPQRLCSPSAPALGAPRRAACEDDLPTPGREERTVTSRWPPSWPEPESSLSPKTSIRRATFPLASASWRCTRRRRSEMLRTWATTASVVPGAPGNAPRKGFLDCRGCAGAQNRVSVRAVPSVESGCSGGASLRNVPYRAWRTPAAATRQVLDCRCGRKNPRFGNMGEACVPDPRRGDGAGVGVPPFTSDFPALAARSGKVRYNGRKRRSCSPV